MRHVVWIFTTLLFFSIVHANDKIHSDKKVKIKTKIEEKIDKNTCEGNKFKKISCANIKNRKRDSFCWKTKRKISDKKVEKFCKKDPSKRKALKKKKEKSSKRCGNSKLREISCKNVNGKKRDFFCWKNKKKISSKKIERICKTNPSTRKKRNNK